MNIKTMNVAYIGYMPQCKDAMGGAEVKTKTILRAIKECGKFDSIKVFNTYRLKSKLLHFALYLANVLVTCDRIIVVASTSSFLRFYMIIRRVNVFHKQIHFIPVGFSELEAKDVYTMREISGIYVQTEYNARELRKAGLNNVYVMHNFKYLKQCQMPYTADQGVFQFCYFARVTPDKGILDTINVLDDLNRDEIVCTLDIYGKVDEDFKEFFLDLIEKKKKYVRYCGIAKPEAAPEIMKKYFMILFPTRFYGEGFPGTILDSFAAGVPVLTSRFASFNDIFVDNVNCLSFEFENYNQMQEKMLYAMRNPKEVEKIRMACRNEFQKYCPKQEVQVLLKNMCGK